MNYEPRHERFMADDIVMASIKRRFIAFTIDGIFIFMLYIIILLLFSLFSLNDWNINVKSAFEVDLETNSHDPYLIFVLKVLFGLFPVIYFTLFLYLTKGRTPGKYIMKLKVVSLYHDRLGLWHCFERSLGYFTSALESGFGFIQAMWNPNRMALHDKIGETIVINIKHQNTKVDSQSEVLSEEVTIENFEEL